MPAASELSCQAARAAAIQLLDLSYLKVLAALAKAGERRAETRSLA